MACMEFNVAKRESLPITLLNNKPYIITGEREKEIARNKWMNADWVERGGNACVCAMNRIWFDRYEALCLDSWLNSNTSYQTMYRTTIVYQMRFDEYSISVCYGMNEPQIKCQLTARLNESRAKRVNQYDKWHTICNKSLLVEPGKNNFFLSRNKSNIHTFIDTFVMRIKVVLAQRITYSNCCREVFYSRQIRAKLYMNAKNENHNEIGSENAHAWFNSYIFSCTHTHEHTHKSVSYALHRRSFLSFNYMVFAIRYTFLSFLVFREWKAQWEVLS